jgi:osmotically-inducible protein OsmY
VRKLVDSIPGIARTLVRAVAEETGTRRMIAAAQAPSNDDRLLAGRIATQLAETNWASLRRLSVDVEAGAVTLRGSVGSFHEKQIAIQACRGLAGIDQLIDAVEVAAAH